MVRRNFIENFIEKNIKSRDVFLIILASIISSVTSVSLTKDPLPITYFNNPDTNLFVSAIFIATTTLITLFIVYVSILFLIEVVKYLKKYIFGNEYRFTVSTLIGMIWFLFSNVPEIQRDGEFFPSIIILSIWAVFIYIKHKRDFRL